MTSIGTRASALAIVPSSEAAPVKPSSALQFTAMRPGFAVTPSFATIENDSKRSSIGRAKPVLGAESPTVSHPSYLKHSGVEGTAPDTSDLLKSVFGTETANATERSTTSGSTASVVKLGAGGSDFARGAGMLIKDGVNGYRIRAVHSVSSNDATLGFQLPVGAAPASGVAVGKCVYYAPANSGHQVVDVWHYIDNGGKIELVGGCRVTELSVEASAGEAITADYSLRGIGYYVNPAVVTSSNRYIDFEDDDGAKSVALAVKTYKDPHDLAAAAQSAMDAASSNTISVSYSDADGKFTFLSDGTTFELQWNTGANTANSAAAHFGDSSAADRTGATTYTSGSAITLAAAFTPSLDDSDMLVAKNNEVLLGDAADYACFEAESVSFSLSNDVVEKRSICAESGISGTLVSGREVTISITALATKYDVDLFRRFRSNTDTRFQFSFGSKDGGNWVPGKCGYLYVPTATISDFKISESDDLCVIEIELTAFVDGQGSGEAYLGFL